MLKALFWKEWRESRLLLAIGILLVIGFSLLPLLYGVYSPKSFSIIITVVAFLAGLFGAEAFSKEKTKLSFLLSAPVKKYVIISIKLLAGFLNIFILFLAGLIIEILILYTEGFNLLILHIKGTSVLPAPGISEALLILWLVFLYYSSTFLMSVLLLDTITAFLTGFLVIIITGYPTLLILDRIGFSNSNALVPILSLVFSLLFLFLSYFIFMRREVRH